MNSTGAMIGVTTGIIIGLIICVIAFRYMNRDGRMKTQYDEMQKISRGRGYMYAFYAVIICEALMIVLSIGDVSLPLAASSIHFVIIFIGIVVDVTYCIFKDAYIGLNTNMKRYIIVMIIVSVINFASAFAGIANGSFMADGRLQGPFINLLCGILFIIVAAELLIKKMIDSRSDDLADA